MGREGFDTFGPEVLLKHLKMTYRAMAFPGDDALCKGVVTAKKVVDDQRLVDCVLWIVNQKGEYIIPPTTATVTFP